MFTVTLVTELLGNGYTDNFLISKMFGYNVRIFNHLVRVTIIGCSEDGVAL